MKESMANRNPRVNITLDPELVSTLNALAKKGHTSVSNLAKDLIEQALELREDYALSLLGESREASSQKRVSHDDAWKK
jgi:predicted DNA-binding protein